jgi:hypothetical protein
MDYETYMSIVSSSEPDEWLHLFNENNEEVFIYKKDLNIWFKKVSTDEMFAGGLWGGETWATNFPDPKAYNVYVYMYYCNSLVDVKRFIAVDGGRVDLPLPELPEKVKEAGVKGRMLEEELKPEEYRFVRKIDYKIACILNNDDERFRSYVSRFEIKDE